MNEVTTRYLGLDVHKETIAVALADPDQAPVLYGTIANDPGGRSANWSGSSALAGR